jgi:hypothetical protein
VKQIGHIRKQYLLFNFGSFRGNFYRRADAVKAAQDSAGDDWRNCYQIIRGEVRLFSDQQPKFIGRERVVK